MPDFTTLLELVSRQQDEEPGDIAAALDRIVRVGRRLFEADLCVAIGVNPLTGQFSLQPAVDGNLTADPLLTSPLPSDLDLSQAVLREGPLFVEASATSKQFITPFSHAQGIESFAATALRIRRNRRPLAVIYIDYRSPQTFDDGRHQLMEDFNRRASDVLDFTWVVRRYRSVAQAGQALIRGLDSVDELNERLAEYLGNIIDTTHEFLLALREPQSDTLDIFSSSYGGKSHIDMRVPPTGAWAWIMDRHESILIRDLAEESEVLPYALERLSSMQVEPKSILTTPLLLEERSVGALAVLHPISEVYDNVDRHILELLASQIALAVTNLHLRDNLRRLQEAERRAADAEAMIRIGQQSYEIAHRLANDLGLVPSSIRKIFKVLVEMNWADARVDKELAAIDRDVRHVLQFSKSLSEALARDAIEERKPWPVRKLLEDAIAYFLAPEAKIPHLFELQIADDKSHVHVAHGEIVSALYNLVTNAIEAMPEGGRIILGASGSQDQVRLWVRDTGHGIEPTQRHKIFNLAYTTKAGGTGFGLWSARRSVLDHGGSIEVESEVGQGTTFTICLPRVAGPSPR